MFKCPRKVPIQLESVRRFDEFKIQAAGRGPSTLIRAGCLKTRFTRGVRSLSLPLPPLSLSLSLCNTPRVLQSTL